MSEGKSVQADLKIKVKTDAVGRAAKAYLKARDALATAKENADDAAANLVKKMRDSKRQSINVEGHVVTLKHVEAQDALTVKKAKTQPV